MAYPTAQFIAGPGTAYWKPRLYSPSTSSSLVFQGSSITGLVPLGIVEKGFEIDPTIFGQRIEGDNLGRSMQDGVQQGGDVFVNFTLQQFNIGGAASIIWPLKASDPTTTTPTHVQGNFGHIGQVGRLHSQLGGELYIALTAGTTGYTGNSFKIIRFRNLTLPENYNPKWAIATRLRNVPIRLQALPYPDANNATVWFETSDADA